MKPAPPRACAGRATKFKFNVGWKFEATSAGFLLAQQRGYYKDAGLDVTIDTGNGSAAAIGLVASGANDCVLRADPARMSGGAQRQQPVAGLGKVAIQYDLELHRLQRMDGPILKPADLAGKTLLGQPFQRHAQAVPGVRQGAGLRSPGVKWENVAPDIGDTRFVKGDFDGAAGFSFTGLLNLKARGMGPEKLRVFRFSDYGMKSYGNGLVANAKSMAQAEAMAAFVKATTRGWIEAMADTKAGAAAVKAREPLANEAIEHERLQLVVDGTIPRPARAPTAGARPRRSASRPPSTRRWAPSA